MIKHKYLSSYQENIDWLFNQFPAFQKVGQSAYKPTLDNTRTLIAQFEVILEKLQFVHVAGTNGKGTTASIIASTFTEAGLKTGLFTSPHINDFRERIRIDGEMILQNKVNHFIETVRELDFQIRPSFFEITWVMALLHFQQEKCDAIVVETGLGGRLDATNVITPLISVITNIGLDHTAILGDTLGQIAMEKAGIIKENIPVVIGQTTADTLPVFKQFSDNRNSPMFLADLDNTNTTFEVNKKIAQTALQRVKLDGYYFDESVFDRALKNLISNTGFRGRFQTIQKDPLTIVDAAHNIDGVTRLVKDVASLYKTKKITAVYGASNDKDIEEILKLIPEDWNVIFTEFKNSRSHSLERFRNVAKHFKFDAKFYTNSTEALDHAQSANNKDDVILIFGSFFLLEEII